MVESGVEFDHHRDALYKSKISPETYLLKFECSIFNGGSDVTGSSAENSGWQLHER